MQEITMNELKNSMTRTDVQPEPLFASSWVALYCLLRNSFAKSRSETGTQAEKDSTGVDPTRH